MNKSEFDNQLKQWENAAKSGDAKASLLLANHYHELGDMEAAFHWYMHTSKQKEPNPIVFFYLGYAYQHGEGTPVDMMEAFAMYKKAVTYDIPQAFYSLAYFYQNGIVVPKNELTAISYMKQATRKMDMLYFMQYDTKAEAERLRADISLQKETAASLFQQNEKLWKENGKLSEQIIQVKNKIEECNKNKEEIVHQFKMTEQQSQVQKKELMECYDKHFLELKRQVDELQNKVTFLTEQNSKLHDELQKMSNHETELWKEIDHRDKSIQEYMKKVGECENLIHETNLRFERCSNTLEASKTENERLSRAVFKMTYWMDENKGTEFASQSLSVFSKFPFTIDGINCISIESFLQSLKFKNKEKQKSICDMPPQMARKYGSKKNGWKMTGNLWWQGKKIKRSGSEYQTLLNSVFSELYKNNDFTRTLLDCGNIEILEKTASQNSQKVILSEDEYVSRLVDMRNLLMK